MRERIKNKQITKEIRGQLPVITPAMFRERGCSYCPYYAGSYEKFPRCMMADCAWDDEEEHFHPVLRQMLPEFKSKMEKAEEKYLELKTAYELLMSMFEAEMAQEELEKDIMLTSRQIRYFWMISQISYCSHIQICRSI